MRVVVDPQRVQIEGHQPFTINATVTNTGSVIGGYHLRVLGADPAWVQMEAENLSLFPDTSQSVSITVAIPPGVGAGDRRMALQVRELTPPQAISVTEIELLVPAREALRLALSPMTVVCGKTGRFSVVAENTGNTPLSMMPVGLDPEDKISFEFVPAVLDLAPGEHTITDLHTRARRRWFGSPVVRPFGLAAVDPDQLMAPPPPPPQPGEIGTPEPPPPPPEPLAQGTMMQKPRLGRGLLSLLSLLLAVSVFAVVITIAMSRLAGASVADRNLALQIAAARGSGAAAGSSLLGGTVNLITDGSPVPGITVALFDAGNLTQPITSTATDPKGTWRIPSLPAGTYKLQFRGAGFAEVWYPNALTGADAKAVQLDAGQSVTNLAVTLGGLPASISGQVTGTDVAGAVLSVQVPQQYLKPVDKTNLPSGSAGGQTLTAQPVPTAAAANAVATSVAGTTGAPGLRWPGRPAAAPTTTDAAPPAAPAPTGTGAAAPPAGGSGGVALPGAVLRTVPLSSDGMFTLANLPSPAVYNLVVSKIGFASDSQLVDLSGGESRTGVILTLRTGDGLISGTVVGPSGPLGLALITATSGTNTVKTLSLNTGAKGTFTLRDLVTPATYTITVTLAGYTPVTSTLTLAAGQKQENVLLSLSTATGPLSGLVTTLADGKPASGVLVTITSGTATALTTVTQSGAQAGTWSVQGLAVPGTYTVTFSRSDLQSQTVAVALNSAGALTSGAGASGGIDVAMRSAFAIVQGSILQQQTTGGTVPVGEATINLTSGAQNYTVSSASTPAAELGSYRVGNVAPGTYTLSVTSTGTTPTTVIITVTAGQVLTYNAILIPPASISGRVTSNGIPLPGTEVDLYLSVNYPATVYRKTTTDADGKYSFTGVDAPQAYVVEARNASTGPLGTATIVLAASQNGVVDIVLGAGSPTSSPPTATPPAATPTTQTTPTSATTSTPPPSTGTSSTAGVPSSSTTTSTGGTT